MTKIASKKKISLVVPLDRFIFVFIQNFVGLKNGAQKIPAFAY